MIVHTKQSGHAVIIGVVVLAAVGLLGLLGWLFWQNFNKQNVAISEVSTFAECKAASGSVIKETSPEQCVTTDGRTFIGPIVSGDEAVQLLTYCTAAEKLCFEYPSTWKIVQLGSDYNEPDASTDHLELRSHSDALVLELVSGIGGLGGTCPEENMVDVTVLNVTPIAAMTGYADDYHVDILHVARVVHERGDGYVAPLYLTTSPDYSKPGVLQACGLGFSQFVAGRNAELGEGYGPGSLSFGYTGLSGPTYATAEDAQAVFDTPSYIEGAAILASVRY